ncbi:hypothetical protein JTE90_009919 [Oedothorax gibbosus]|uniref:Uncharacterized protein n=1 Tax=Oedothorax gibbosus TaxID=931172 RepID=A0AAV6UX28_9ARAC|nr:hypothetical protein JTE90_009919 [Oedothorax gibbosus]
MEDICLQSQDLSEVPSSILEEKVKRLNLEFNNIASLPLELCQKLPHLTFLSLNGNMLETLPSNIGSLTGLTEFYLKENSLTALPESIIQLKNLKKLHLTGNNLKKLPENIHFLENLHELVADENTIKNLPSSFGGLKLLSHLNLSFNEIENLSDNFGGLESLKELDLSNNCLTSLPENFSLLPSLEVLDLNSNKINKLPNTFQSAYCLKKILVAQNILSEIPRWFSKMKNVKEVFLSENNLHGDPFPEDFGSDCDNLEQLDVSGNNITSLPESIGKLKSLTFLDLGSSFDELERNPMISNGNDIVYLPSTFCGLQNISKLELDENQIKELPHDFGLLSNLAYLDLSHNLLQALPDSFGHLKNLKVCLLSMNYMKSLPESFGMLPSIEDLKLDLNLLEELPESFEKLTTLINLDLYKNCLKEFPKSLKNLKFLKGLDLRENNFGSTLDALALAYEPSYPIRDPEQENNWRGRKRPDIQPNAWVEKKTPAVMNKEHLENDILYNAMVSASSLWRKHGQTDIRSKNPNALATNDLNQINGYPEKETSNEELIGTFLVNNVTSCKQEIENVVDTITDELQCKTLDDESIVENETEFWDENVQSNVSSKSSSVSSEENLVDTDFEDCDFETDCKIDFPKNFTRTYEHTTNNLPSEVNELFIPSDLHISTACGPEMWDTIEDGQFDDADS